MEASGYSRNYIYKVQKEILWILSEAELRDWECYKDIYHHYKTVIQTQKTFIIKRAIIGIIEHFDLYCKYPDSKWKCFARKNAYTRLIPAFKELIDYYIKKEKTRGKKASSINTESQNASNFLFAMQEAGVSRLDEITEEAAMALFVSHEGKQLRGYTYRRSVTALFESCLSIDPDACKRILTFLPMGRNTRKNIQYLTAQEVKKIRETLEDMSNTLSKCDRAIGKLALYTGLRGSDIAAMEVTSIDWEHEVIKINQQKTGNSLELPLTITVGNAIYDYLTSERPSVNNTALFLSLIGPNRRMAADNMGNVSARIMKAAGIRQTKGERKGLHIFRHHLATTLLGNNVSQAVISRTLGHSSPSSTETYLSADFAHLKDCALSISQFPISEEVLSIG